MGELNSNNFSSFFFFSFWFFTEHHNLISPNWKIDSGWRSGGGHGFPTMEVQWKYSPMKRSILLYLA